MRAWVGVLNPAGGPSVARHSHERSIFGRHPGQAWGWAGNPVPSAIADRFWIGYQQYSGGNRDPRVVGDVRARGERSSSFVVFDATGTNHDDGRRLAGSGGGHLPRSQTARDRARASTADSSATGGMG